ncbi:hypothetical protein [Turneriella parva]|uniref:Uncharacterized protein n=1 Tax=Turneriella parva (strain ATCC BAA-1111 / DSM 21527 / NCTC 11395 / H) TaxID=869212 RepID=I4B9T2_TURPD|nr:hypothetical protein [Turneriella parva]AFM14039.1 hypothetical protein Turpa_3402 [Turneriella parva DSM 21527]
MGAISKWLFALMMLVSTNIIIAEEQKEPRKRKCMIGAAVLAEPDCDGIYMWGPGLDLAAANGGFALGGLISFGYVHDRPLNSWWSNVVFEYQYNVFRKQDNLFLGAEIAYKLLGLEVAYHILKSENLQGVSLKPFVFLAYGFVYYRFNYFPQLTYHEFGISYKFPVDIYQTKP